MPTLHEEWRPVPDYEGVYEVSNLGRVRSLPRLSEPMWNRWGGTHQRRYPGKILRPSTNGVGYPQVILYHPEKSPKTGRIHLLVAAAFIGPKPDGHEVNHKDFDPSNCRADNLEYVTPTENVRYSTRAGRGTTGEHNGCAKLTIQQVRQIRALRGSATIARIADMFGVSTTAVQGILAGRTWKHWK